MDLAIYINEFLGLHGVVYVPGLGSFIQQRINGYYNERENKFYPPRHEVVFDPALKEDESLAAYISQKKNISPASANYFIEKYVTGLKQQASEQKVDITGLGHLFYEYSALAFKADKSYEASDPSFYGLAPAKAYKGPGKTRAPETPRPVEPPPAVVPPATPQPEPEPVASSEDTYSKAVPQEDVPAEEPEAIAFSEDIYQEDTSRNSNNIWVIVLLILIIGLLAFSAAYQYKPEWFGKPRPVDTTIIINGPPPSAVKTDSGTKIAPAKDTVAKIKAIDTFAVVRYEIQAGSFRTISKTNEVMQSYEKLGLHPREIKNTSGSLHRITLGTYFDSAEAQRLTDSIKKIPNITPGDISLQTYNPTDKK